MKIRLQVIFDKNKEKPPGLMKLYDLVSQIPGIKITGYSTSRSMDREPPVRLEKNIHSIHYTFEVEATSDEN